MKKVKLFLAVGILVVSTFGIVMCMNDSEEEFTRHNSSPIIEIEKTDEGDLVLCTELLAEGKYEELFQVLDQAVITGNFIQFDWAVATGLDMLNVPLLHWSLYHKLVTSSGMITTEELEDILHTILLVLVRTKVDEIVCARLDGSSRGRGAYELLRAQYYSLLEKRHPFLEQVQKIDFLKLSEDVFSFFYDQEENSDVKQSDLLGTPIWVYHVRLPQGLFGWNLSGRVVFESLPKAKLSWGLENKGSDSLVQMVPRAAITKERNSVAEKFKERIQGNDSWLNFIQDSCENFRTING